MIIKLPRHEGAFTVQLMQEAEMDHLPMHLVSVSGHLISVRNGSMKEVIGGVQFFIGGTDFFFRFGVIRCIVDSRGELIWGNPDYI
ncbi:hypothetical protein HY249_02820 [Candidatus Azambacteria bacterium]|nr:hypothetical protein [Candidatus Azambacteria bacterium]